MKKEKKTLYGFNQLAYTSLCNQHIYYIFLKNGSLRRECTTLFTKNKSSVFRMNLMLSLVLKN